MDNRRFVTFLVCFFAFTYLYNGLIAPRLFPRPEKRPVPAVVENNDAADPTSDTDGSETPDSADPLVAEKDNEAPTVAMDKGPAVFPNERVVIGSLDPTSGFLLEVRLNSAGAAIESVQLSDPAFTELTDINKQLVVVGNNATDDRTFSTAITTIDEQLAKHQLKLETIDWEVVTADERSATFSFEAPDHSLRVEKTFRLQMTAFPAEQMRDAFLTDAAGFTIETELKVTNLSSKPQAFEYELQGPVGVVLENVEHTRKYRDIKIEFVGEEDDVVLGAKALNKLYEAHIDAARGAGQGISEDEIRQKLKTNDSWTGVFRYAGIDVQFFAGLVAPLDDRPEAERLANKWIDRTYPVMVQQDRIDVNQSDISFRMASSPQSLPAKGDSLVHKYAFFVGPKRSELLDPKPMEADQVLDYGSWFGFIARGMHRLLSWFYSWGMPYALAIICLTVLVRGCMFPLSRKQAISAARMKDLQPKINELKLKYGEDKEKMAKAQMELWRKHNINPLGGCFPLLFQFPIFIALYTCLNTAVDLRLAPFLWIENLAAPDALFRMPAALPILGQDFNLLPCITVVLFFIQQKLFMPPPTDEQQAAQQKMMNFMTLFFGFMFWHMPAGLCLYFIASSMWGIAERTLLGKTSTSTEATTEPSVTVKDVGSARGVPNKNGAQAKAPATEKKQGFFQKLMEAAETAQKQAEKTKEKQNKSRKKKGR
ncbi:MAG: YidC/Oxa1 family insertase periplasmic-domain containing protein [Fuerstiella sp.]|jgi:YidC/Oxa1 family membrane protein insertase|nr:YidC/Oxa1 family insertase periplasmic-domain containing protein [Fuerstiella sp.]